MNNWWTTDEWLINELINKLIKGFDDVRTYVHTDGQTDNAGC